MRFTSFNELNILPRKCYTVYHHRILGQCIVLHKDIDTAHGFLIPTLLNMSNIGGVIFHGFSMLDIDSITPFQIVCGGFMGKCVVLDNPDGEFINKRIVNHMGNMIMYGRNTGNKIFIRTQQINIKGFVFIPLFINLAGLKIEIPREPANIGAVAYLGIIGAKKMIVGVEQCWKQYMFFLKCVGLFIGGRKVNYFPLVDPDMGVFHHFVRRYH